MRITSKVLLSTIVVVVLSMSFLNLNLQAANGAADTEYSAISVKNGGAISGVITYEGELPALTPMEVTKDRKVCGKNKPDESLLVDPKTQGIQNVVVYVKNIKSGKSWSRDTTLQMEQIGCVFTPRVLIVPANQPFYMLNNDGILHNIHTRSELNRAINKAQPKFLKKLKLSFAKPEFVKVACDVHNWMAAWVVVADNPYYTSTDAKGGFELTNIPAGTYELEIWHEKLGKQTTQVEVTAGQVAIINRTLK